MLYMTSSSTNSGVVEHQRDLRRHARPGRRAGRRAEPRQPGARPDADRGPDDRHHRVRSRPPASSWRSASTPRTSAYDSLFLSNYIDVYVKDALKRVPGVGDVIIFGERKYSMRLWLDPDRLAGAAATAGDVVNALREQNVQVAAGSLGQSPAPAGQMYQLSVRALGRLREASEFDNIILKSGADGSLVRLKDVGRAELGAETYSAQLRFQGVEAVGFGVIQLPTANALDVERGVVAELERLAEAVSAGHQVSGRVQHD